MSSLIAGAVARHARLGATALVAVAVAASPALAQKGPASSGLSLTALIDGYAHCMNAADDKAMAEATLADLGWTLDEEYPAGAFQTSVSASLTQGNDEAYFYADIETYPTVMLVYCTYTVYGSTAGVDLATMAAEFGLEGGTIADGQGSEDFGTYGVWEQLLDDSLVLIRAEVFSDSVYIQVNWVGDAPVGQTGPVK